MNTTHKNLQVPRVYKKASKDRSLKMHAAFYKETSDAYVICALPLYHDTLHWQRSFSARILQYTLVHKNRLSNTITYLRM